MADRQSAGGVIDAGYLIRRAGRTWPDVAAVDDGRRALTMSELVRRGERFANALDARGVEPDARVAVLSENRSEYVEADVGIAFAGRTRVALNSRLTLPEFSYAVEDAGVSVLLHSQRFHEEAGALADDFGLLPISFDRSPDAPGPIFGDLIDEASSAVVRRARGTESPAWITYTSGTTGQPKGVVLSQRSIREVAINLLVELGAPAPGEQLVLPQPLSHGAGYFVLPYLMSGGGVRILDRFEPDRVFAVSNEPPVRTLKLVPTMLAMLLEHDAQPLGFDTIVYGAAPIPAPVLEASLDRFGPLLVQIYGQSEAPVTLTCLHKRDHEGDGKHRFSAGRAWRSVAVEVRGEDGQPIPAGERGEVVVSGSHLMSGYHNRPQETAEVLSDGWVRTRDVGVMDERGFVFLLGRTDEMINSGGFNIAPREVEQVLTGHPDIEEACVVGIPDERWSAVVAALIRPRTGARPEAEELIQFAKPRLGFRAPKRVVILDQIPKNAYGKIDRAAVRARAEEAAR